jgi:hypothetical protein
MGGRLPKRLMLGLGVAAVLFLILGAYAETFQLRILQEHPILTNLLSGLIAFPCASLAIAFGFNWFVERERLIKLRVTIPEAWKPIATYWAEVQTKEDEDPEIAALNESGRFNCLIRKHEQMIKFRVPLVVHLLDLQDDFLVISHLRLAEEQYSALVALSSSQATIARRAGMNQLTTTILNLVRRIATSENGRKLELPATCQDMHKPQAA